MCILSSLAVLLFAVTGLFPSRLPSIADRHPFVLLHLVYSENDHVHQLALKALVKYSHRWSGNTFVAFFFKSRSIQICQMRSIQSSEKERTDLSGSSGRGHLVLICEERRRPHLLLLLQVNTLHRRPAAQMGVAKSEFCQICQSDLGLIKNTEHFAPIDLDLYRFEKECNQYNT